MTLNQTYTVEEPPQNVGLQEEHSLVLEPPLQRHGDLLFLNRVQGASKPWSEDPSDLHIADVFLCLTVQSSICEQKNFKMNPDWNSV